MQGGAGLLVDPTDVDAVAAALSIVLEDDALADRLARAGRERAMRYTWDGSADLVLRAYRDAGRVARAQTSTRGRSAICRNWSSTTGALAPTVGRRRRRRDGRDSGRGRGSGIDEECVDAPRVTADEHVVLSLAETGERSERRSVVVPGGMHAKPVETRCVRDGDGALGPERRVVLDYDDARPDGLERVQHPVVVAVDVDGKHVEDRGYLAPEEGVYVVWLDERVLDDDAVGGEDA